MDLHMSRYRVNDAPPPPTKRIRDGEACPLMRVILDLKQRVHKVLEKIDNLLDLVNETKPMEEVSCQDESEPMEIEVSDQDSVIDQLICHEDFNDIYREIQREDKLASKARPPPIPRGRGRGRAK
ncbi:hypothetical protein ACFE04_030820 [Oxalis oulophora]